METAARTTLLSLVAGLLGCGTASSTCGCHPYDCAEWSTCAAEAPPPGPTCVADPSIGRAEDACGVFVSASLGDDASPGTRERPVRTIAQAIALAQRGPMRIYACAETFSTAVTLPAGIDLWGGLDCENDWIYVGADRPTEIAPEPDSIPLQVKKIGEGGLATVADLRLVAADATQPSGSSIAMIVLPDTAVDILRSALVAGNGADGLPGEGIQTPAKVGTPGTAGGPACSADLVPGAPSVTTVCDEIYSIGGRGGDGNATIGSAGNDGQPEPVPNPNGYGLGGAGEVGSSSCMNGIIGLNGADGAHGNGAQGPGKIHPELGWEGRPGKDGGDGLPGQGGGGGGGARGSALLCGSVPTGGASGGSGGGGGCGGKGGKGGGYGGASIGLVSFSGDVTVSLSSIVTGNGGNGGAGGIAQAGGIGGASGSGGLGAGLANPGCQGGPGGKGGNGGYGGGGLGGSSLGVAHIAGLPVAILDNTMIATGQPGAGGPGGNQNVPGSAGEDGTRADTLGFPQ